MLFFAVFVFFFIYFLLYDIGFGNNRCRVVHVNIDFLKIDVNVVNIGSVNIG